MVAVAAHPAEVATLIRRVAVVAAVVALNIGSRSRLLERRKASQSARAEQRSQMPTETQAETRHSEAISHSTAVGLAAAFRGRVKAAVVVVG